MSAPLKVLAVAVASGRIGYVLMKGEELLDWGMSRKAAKSPAQAIKQTKRWISRLKPDMVITEDAYRSKHKGANTKALIEVITDVAQRSGLANAAVVRLQPFKNKYEEARHIAERFPDILPWLPRPRRLWEAEPRNTIYFEAIALARAAAPAS